MEQKAAGSVCVFNLRLSEDVSEAGCLLVSKNATDLNPVEAQDSVVRYDAEGGA